MDTCRVSINAALINSRLAHIKAVLIVDFDSVEPDIEEITVRRVQVELEHETHRHRYRFVLLEELHLVCLSVKTSLNRYDLVISPSEHVRQLNCLANVFEPVHGSRCHAQGDSFLRCHQPVINANDDLSNASECVL